MLTQITPPPAKSPRNHRRERRLWHDPHRQPMQSLGCTSCPERALCGGLQTPTPIFDCLDFCCGGPETCDSVCRNHPGFVGHVREVRTFALDTVPRIAALPAPALGQTIPVVFHRGSRTTRLHTPEVALPLAQMFKRRDGAARFATREAFEESFRIAPGSRVLLSGTDHDTSIERWWGLGETCRRELIRNFRTLGVALATTPNYSLFIDVPRWDGLHAMKRIAIVHHEFLSEGMPCALHINGRTETDFRRWIEYVGTRPEVTHLAYELTTGTGWAGRQQQHALWLCELAEQVRRPLTLIIRGGTEVLADLVRAYAQVTLLETTSFMKAIKRQKASLYGRLDWQSSPTESGAPIDAIFEHNVQAVQLWVNQIVRESDHEVIH